MIPKRPTMPDFEPAILNHIETAVFDFHSAATRPSYAFVFGGTHFGAWEKTIEANLKYQFKKIFVTGGHKKTGVQHRTWTYGNSPEAEIITQKLLEAGISEERIEVESESENTKDNILNIIGQIPDHRNECIALIGRSYAMGRQARTFRNFCGEIETVPIVYDMEVNETPGLLRRRNWRDCDVWKSVVWGEYIRIIVYGRLGHVLVDFTPPDVVLEKLEQYLA